VSLADRLARLEARRAAQRSAIAKRSLVPGPSPSYLAFVKLLNLERAEIDAADRAAMGKPLEEFGEPASPEPLTPEEEAMLASEPTYEGSEAGEEWFLNMLLDLRAGAGPDVIPAKLAGIDKAITEARKELQKGAPHEGESGK
jgi:hypothetical protein